MNTEGKKVIKKVIYSILFVLMIAAFIYLSEKYAANSSPKIVVMQDFYSEIKSDKFEVIRGKKFISLIKSGKSIVFIGNSNSEYSTKYANELEQVIESINNVSYTHLTLPTKSS